MNLKKRIIASSIAALTAAPFYTVSPANAEVPSNLDDVQARAVEVTGERLDTGESHRAEELRQSYPNLGADYTFRISRREENCVEGSNPNSELADLVMASSRGDSALRARMVHNLSIVLRHMDGNSSYHAQINGQDVICYSHDVVMAMGMAFLGFTYDNTMNPPFTSVAQPASQSAVEDTENMQSPYVEGVRVPVDTGSHVETGSQADSIWGRPAGPQAQAPTGFTAEAETAQTESRSADDLDSRIITTLPDDVRQPAGPPAAAGTTVAETSAESTATVEQPAERYEGLPQALGSITALYRALMTEDVSLNPELTRQFTGSFYSRLRRQCSHPDDVTAIGTNEGVFATDLTRYVLDASVVSASAPELNWPSGNSVQDAVRSLNTIYSMLPADISREQVFNVIDAGFTAYGHIFTSPAAQEYLIQSRLDFISHMASTRAIVEPSEEMPGSDSEESPRTDSDDVWDQIGGQTADSAAADALEGIATSLPQDEEPEEWGEAPRFVVPFNIGAIYLVQPGLAQDAADITDSFGIGGVGSLGFGGNVTDRLSLRGRLTYGLTYEDIETSEYAEANPLDVRGNATDVRVDSESYNHLLLAGLGVMGRVSNHTWLGVYVDLGAQVRNTGRGAVEYMFDNDGNEIDNMPRDDITGDLSARFFGRLGLALEAHGFSLEAGVGVSRNGNSRDDGNVYVDGRLGYTFNIDR